MKKKLLLALSFGMLISTQSVKPMETNPGTLARISSTSMNYLQPLLDKFMTLSGPARQRMAPHIQKLVALYFQAITDSRYGSYLNKAGKALIICKALHSCYKVIQYSRGKDTQKLEIVSRRIKKAITLSYIFGYLTSLHERFRSLQTDDSTVAQLLPSSPQALLESVKSRVVGMDVWNRTFVLCNMIDLFVNHFEQSRNAVDRQRELTAESERTEEITIPVTDRRNPNYDNRVEEAEFTKGRTEEEEEEEEKAIRRAKILSLNQNVEDPDGEAYFVPEDPSAQSTPQYDLEAIRRTNKQARLAREENIRQREKAQRLAKLETTKAKMRESAKQQAAEMMERRKKETEERTAKEKAKREKRAEEAAKRKKEFQERIAAKASARKEAEDLAKRQEAANAIGTKSRFGRRAATKPEGDRIEKREMGDIVARNKDIFEKKIETGGEYKKPESDGE